MNTVRRRVAVLLVALVGTGGTLVTTGPAAAAPAPGTVLSTTAATLPAPLAGLATGKRIEYVSTDVQGATITATGLILTPKTGKTDKTVAWAHGTTGLADRCAPSNHPDLFWPEARAAVAGLLSRGWTVAAADYPGLGTPQQHPYLIGASEARAIIDSVRAARSLDGTLSKQYVVEGHSQGGQGALFAGELAPRYDDDLVLRGVVSIAPVSNVDLLAPFIPDAPNRGYLVMGLAGLATVETSLDPLGSLAPPAQQRLEVLQDGCLNEILAAYEPLTRDELLVGGALSKPVVDRLARWDNPAQAAPSAPILIVQGTADDAVPYDVTVVLVSQLQAYQKVPVQFETIEGADHEGAVFQSVALVNAWIVARFAA